MRLLPQNVTLRRLYAFFVVEHAKRRVHVLVVTARPNGDCVAQEARNLVIDFEDALRRVRFLIRDRDTKFTSVLEAGFTDSGIEVITTPVPAPRANAIAEPFGGSVRRKLMNWILIFNTRHLLWPSTSSTSRSQALLGHHEEAPAALTAENPLADHV